MRTIVYVDGFNLYFGCLKNTSHKWLDLQKLIERLCREQNPSAEILSIKYFTAEISPRLSPRGEQSYNAQRDYLLALKATGDQLEVILGKFFICASSLYPREAGTRNPESFESKVDVWRPEEKQTDVNIALHMLCDAQDSICDQQVLVTNDSDLSPILNQLRIRYPDITQGVISPIPQGRVDRRPSSELKQRANWIRSHIKASELQDAQLPPFVLTRKRKIEKPDHW